MKSCLGQALTRAILRYATGVLHETETAKPFNDVTQTNEAPAPSAHGDSLARGSV